ncbi:MAG: TIGR00366 family protein [Actinobacteria bacterium]|nr:TIGR00366 family protein [Actinomycetota bacterium]MCA1737317.1 TIGR00366 family protein [Actinomycetota bacterium]
MEERISRPETAGGGNRVVAFFVGLAERYLPDAFLFAVVLTLITYLLAVIFVTTDLLGLIGAWYNGLWNILTFALQMALILLTGYVVAQSPPVSRFLNWLASKPQNQGQALALTIVVASIASLINWGFGLVVAAIMARFIGKRLENVDYAILVSAGYAGFIVWASGLSSSIALAVTTPGSSANITEQETGQILGFGDTILTWWNILPVIIIIALLIPLYWWMMPQRPEQMRKVNRELLTQEDEGGEPETPDTPAGKLERFWPLNLILAGAIFIYFISSIVAGTFKFDFNAVIALFLALGLILHWTPIRYVRTFTGSAYAVGPIALQYPLYGGIQGLMTFAVGGVALAGVIASWFLSFSNEYTFAFWSFVSSNIISLFIPSGGGHWVVQGPVMVPAAESLGVDQGLVAMTVAWGEGTANMIQPFWALPILGIVGLGIREIMGYGVLTLALSFTVYGAFALIAPFFL